MQAGRQAMHRNESCSLIGLNANANGINHNPGCVRYVMGTVWGKF